jgi:hypothetical protein
MVYSIHMKKYTLILSVFVFILGFLGLFTINANVVNAANCAPGELFSSVTGQSCGSNTTSVVTCPTGDLFNILTGQRCTAWSNNSNSGDDFSDLGIGSRGDLVRAFQQMLRDSGFLSGKADGIYGRMTDGAAKKYYQAHPVVSIPPAECPLYTDSSGNITHKCPITEVPVISGVSGPQTLNVNEQGKWNVIAYDKNGGNLAYSVTWGDETYYANTYMDGRFPATIQSGTFTHIYSSSGIFTPKFTVSNSSGQSASTSLSVNVGSVQQSFGYLSVSPTSASVEAGETVTLQAIYQPPMPTCLKDFGCVQMMPASYPVQATWKSSNTNVAKVEYKNTCPPGAYCFVGPDLLTAVVTGVSSGTAKITATYKDGQLVATTQVTVTGNGISNSVMVTSPNGGETWMKGTTQNITWQDNSTTLPCPAGTGCYKPAPKYYDIKLDTYRAPCTGQVCPMYMIPAPFTIATGVSGSSYGWSVGKILNSYTDLASDGQYMVEVCQSGTSVCDSSNNYFTISSNTTADLTITTSSTLPNAKVGNNYYLNFSASGGSGTYAWNLYQGPVPQGMTFSSVIPECANTTPNSSSCQPTFVLSGTPTYAYTYRPTVQVTSGSEVVRKQLTLTVDPADSGTTCLGGAIGCIRISSLSPSYGTVGTQVMITGSGFTATGNRITFGNLGVENSSAYNLPSYNGTTIVFTVPYSNYMSCWYSMPACMAPNIATQPGSYNVYVTNSLGTSLPAVFTVTK